MSVAVFIAYLIGCVVLLVALLVLAVIAAAMVICVAYALWDAVKPLKGRT